MISQNPKAIYHIFITKSNNNMYFPDELFSIIKEYVGIVGMSQNHIIMLNKTNVKDLQILTEPYTKKITFDKIKTHFFVFKIINQ